jgi:epoxyqueuosine reductase
MPTSISNKRVDLLARLREQAGKEGLHNLSVATATLPDGAARRLEDFVNNGRHGDMDWLVSRLHQRLHPQNLWPDARSAIVFALPYGQGIDPLARLRVKNSGNISVYALNRDYHDVFKGKLKRIAQWLAHETAAEVKVFVDTAPLMEKPLAERAGLGWQGKHTNLVSRELGSWFFLGCILTTLEFEVNAAEQDHCGSCRACLDICPTKAFPAPYQLDARRCISYLTIEHRGHIPLEFREPMGNRIYGCDDCLAVCPWNKFAQIASEQRLMARDDLLAPSLAKLLRLDDGAFRKMFAGSPVKRTGRNRFLRNCLIASGNSGDHKLAESVRVCLSDESPLVRAMAVWALLQLDSQSFAREKEKRLSSENDSGVRAEWQAAA